MILSWDPAVGGVQPSRASLPKAVVRLPYGSDVAAGDSMASCYLTDLLRELGLTARELGTGALLIVDELQGTPASELSALNRAIHAAGQGTEPLRILLMGAGLPTRAA
jgi:hypothetical protein